LTANRPRVATPPTQGRRRRVRVARVMMAVAALATGSSLAVTQALAAISDAISGPRFTRGALALSDDAAASSLFTVDNMAPGHPVSRCIAVSYRGGESPAPVKLHGAVTGGLEQSLQLTIEAGSGGRFGDCTGFNGRVLYRGTLAGFTAAHRDFPSGLDTFTPSGSSGLVTFRFSVVLVGDALERGRTARASFTWEARDVPVAGRSGQAATGGADDRRSSTDQPGGAVQPGGAGARTSPERRSEGSRSLLESVAQVALEVAKKIAFPMILVIIVGLFLVLQDAIDRRDPKLALAPVHPDPDLPFTPTGRER
jgi:hypothetical protein